MTTHQIKLVQESWAAVVPIADTAASLFYGKLFELDPELRPLFRTNLVEQGKKLMQMITMAVQGLRDLEKLVPTVENLGRRHVSYRVRQKDYATVGEALLWTLETGLGPAFTPDIREAWTEVYTLLSTTMINAASKELALA